MRKDSPGPACAAMAGAALFILAAACGLVETSTRVLLDLPAAPAVDLQPYREIVLCNFRQDKETPEFDLSKALLEYLRDEIEHVYKGRLTKASIPWGDGRIGANPDLWENALPDPKGRLILTGTAQFGQETRKALVGSDRRAIDDGPFAPEKPWAERKVFALKLEITLIRPDSGEVLFRKEYAESATSENTKQPPEFAFYEMLQTIRTKFFRALFGTQKIQERYLLSRE